jgi:hypothetical protein
MVRVTHIHDDGTELATIEVDDFTVEILYSGIASMLRDAAFKDAAPPPPPVELSRDARSRRERILNRIYG